jgi:SAM-dependent methyltransferase
MADVDEVKDGQRQVIEHFTSGALTWDWFYRGTDASSRIFQRRHKVIFRMISRLSLPKNACVLEVGCGAGLAVVELARRGYTVQAVDLVKRMIDLTLQNAAQANVSDKVFASIGDVQSLHFADNTFDLVLAVGVLPYLDLPFAAVKEMARVARPDSYLIFTSDNYWRLDRILDPDWSPLLKPLKHFALKVLNLKGHKRKRMPDYVYSIEELRVLVNLARLQECKVVTSGYGSFTFHGKKMPDRVGVWLNERLQQLAERDPEGLLSRLGSHCIFLARKTRTYL